MKQSRPCVSVLIIVSFDGNHCLFLKVEGRLFDVKEFFLEDILKLTGFNRKDMNVYKEEKQKSMKLFYKSITKSWLDSLPFSQIILIIFFRGEKTEAFDRVV